MKKIVDLLEQNVQWLVLTLSIAWVIYIAWAYLLNPPVSVVLAPGGKALLPSEVDNAIYEEGAADLDRKIRNSAPATAPTPPGYAAQFREAMTYASEPAPVLASSRWILPSTPYIFVTAVSDNPAVPNAPADLVARGPRPTENTAGLVAELPELPPARLGDNRTGMSFVQVTPNSTGADKAWVSIRFEIDSAAMAKAWDLKKIPERNYSNTTFLQVSLDRQELQPDGNWSQPVTIAPLANSQLLPLPQGGNAKENFEYAKWAAPRQRDILQPAFYTIVKGDPWLPPGVAGADAAPAMENFKAADHIHDTAEQKKLLTLEQRQQVQAEIAKDKEKHRPPPRVATPPRRGPAPAAPATPQEGPRDSGRPASMDGGAISFQARSEEPEEDANGLPIPPKRATPAAPAPGVPAAAPTAPPPGAAAPGAKPDEFPVPTAEFDPHKWAADHAANPSIVGWVHDDSVQPGHVYKYRVTYKVKNPIFTMLTKVQDSKLADTFALTSIPSDWSEQVEVASTLKFFVAGARPTTGTAAFQVFRRQEGELKTKTFTVGPGDVIGTKDGDVDFTTDWVVVDVRTDRVGGDAYVLLMDKSGTLVRRDANADASNPDYLRSKQQAAGTGGGAATVPHSEPIAAK